MNHLPIFLCIHCRVSQHCDSTGEMRCVRQNPGTKALESFLTRTNPRGAVMHQTRAPGSMAPAGCSPQHYPRYPNTPQPSPVGKGLRHDARCSMVLWQGPLAQLAPWQETGIWNVPYFTLTPREQQNLKLYVHQASFFTCLD